MLGFRMPENVMRRSIFTILMTLFASFVLVQSAFSQGDGYVFDDPNIDYKVELPNSNWKVTMRPSETSRNVAFTYGDRSSGYLEIRKLTVKADLLMAEVIEDEEVKFRFEKGYVAGKQENFSGRLEGRVFNFEFVKQGRNITGRFYFLRDSRNPTVIYLLRFTGHKEKLSTIRNETDDIARRFSLK